jgi:hypothetical protein
MKVLSPRLVAVIAILGFSALALAASPDFSVVTPRGAQRGTEADIVLHGARLNDAKEILFYQPGITVTKLDTADQGNLKAHIQISKDAAIGEYPLRIRTATGLTDIRTFFVTAYPVVEEKEPNNDQAHAQPIPLNTTVAGTVTNEDLDYFVVDLKKGQRITAEVQGIRLGDAMFDPYIAIYDEKKFALAQADDTALGRQDPIASAIAPADGKYYILVRESTYGGGGNYFYLLSIGTFPRPTTVFPLGGKVGDDLNVRYIGDVAGEIKAAIKLPGQPTEMINIFAEQDGMIAPTPNFLRVSPFPNVLEQDGDNDIGHATPVPMELPVAVNGIISKDGESDFYKFKAHKGQVLDIRVYARQLRSPLDSVIGLYNAKGNQLASNDDSGGPDSYLRFNPPEDGDYFLQVRDQLLHGGPDYTYRVELTPAKPSITIRIPEYNNLNQNQERNRIIVPRGNRFGSLIRTTRSEFGGDVQLQFPDLPQGVTASFDPVAGSVDVVPVVFEAAPDAPQVGKLCDVTAKPVDPKINAIGTYLQTADLVYGQNNAAMYKIDTHKLAVAVLDEVPYKLHVIQPKVPVVRNGEMKLKVVAERAKDFKGSINLRMLFNPPGIGSAANVEIPGDKNEAEYPVSANPNAELRKWKICVLGSSDVNGAAWASSELTDLEVADSYMDLKIDLAATEQGKPAQVVVHLDNKTKFDGKAEVKLLGLPRNATASDMQISADDKQVVFNVNTAPDTPVGQHGSLFCQITVMQNGEPVLQSLGRGGVLRVDPPPQPKKGEQPKPAAAQAPAPNAPAAKPLSRLEKLRQEAGK